MKYKIKILVLASIVLSSCLKDTGYTDTMNDKGSTIVEIKEATTSNSILLALNSTPAVEEIEIFEIRIGSKNATGKDYKIKLSPNNALVAALSTSYVIPNSTQVEIPSLEVTIPAGSNEVKFKIKVNKNNLNLSNIYALGFNISDGDGAVISENSKQIVAVLSVKNQWDGVYNLRMRLDGWAAFGISDGISGTHQNINLITESATSVTTGVLQPGFTGGLGVITGQTAFGATSPRYIFNSSDNKVTSVVNTLPDDGRGRTLFLNPAITTSRYDPATKKIYVAYVMTQNGRPNQLITDTMTYIGPR